MTKSQLAALLERRLGISSTRTVHLSARLSDAGIISRTEGSRRFPCALAEHEIVAVFVAAVANPQLGDTAKTVQGLLLMDDCEGRNLGDALADVLFERIQMGVPGDLLIVRQAPLGAALVVNGAHRSFGPPAPETGAIRGAHVTGSTIAAIAAELGGAGPKYADAMAALARLQFSMRHND